MLRLILVLITATLATLAVLTPITASANHLVDRLRQNCNVFGPKFSPVPIYKENLWFAEMVGRVFQDPSQYEISSYRSQAIGPVDPVEDFERRSEAREVFEVLASTMPLRYNEDGSAVKPFETMLVRQPLPWLFKLSLLPESTSNLTFAFDLLVDQVAGRFHPSTGEMAIRISWRRRNLAMTPEQTEVLTQRVAQAFQNADLRGHPKGLRKSLPLRGVFVKSTDEEHELPQSLLLFLDVDEFRVDTRFALNLRLIRQLRTALTSAVIMNSM